MNYSPNISSSLLRITNDMKNCVNNNNDNQELENFQNEVSKCGEEAYAESLYLLENDLDTKIEFYTTLVNAEVENDVFPFNEWVKLIKSDNYKDWQIRSSWIEPIIKKINTPLVFENIAMFLNTVYKDRPLQIYDAIHWCKEQLNTSNISDSIQNQFWHILETQESVHPFINSLTENQQFHLENPIWNKWSSVALAQAIDKNQTDEVLKKLQILNTFSHSKQEEIINDLLDSDRGIQSFYVKKTVKVSYPFIFKLKWENIKSFVELNTENLKLGQKSNLTHLLAEGLMKLIDKKKHLEFQEVSNGFKMDNKLEVANLLKLEHKIFLDINLTHGENQSKVKSKI